jgi:hypothetical protein
MMMKSFKNKRTVITFLTEFLDVEGAQLPGSPDNGAWFPLHGGTHQTA